MILKSKRYLLSSCIACILTICQASLKSIKIHRPIKHALDAPECGISNVGNTRIVGGRSSELHAWPWIALIGYGRLYDEYDFECGGTLVSSKTVLTAVHCVTDDIAFVRLGEHNLAYDNEDGSKPHDYSIARAIIHPRYERESLHNDVAVLILHRQVKFTDYIHPICLPIPVDVRNRSFVGEHLIVAGWGSEIYDGGMSTTLHDAIVPVISTASCKARYKRLIPVNDNYICASYLRGGIDACQGDSGGPLMYSMNNTYYLVGIVSSGIDCGNPKFPGLYMRVANYLDFILKYMV